MITSYGVSAILCLVVGPAFVIPPLISVRMCAHGHAHSRTYARMLPHVLLRTSLHVELMRAHSRSLPLTPAHSRSLPHVLENDKSREYLVTGISLIWEYCCIPLQIGVDRDLKIQSFVADVYENCGYVVSESTAFLVPRWMDFGKKHYLLNSIEWRRRLPLTIAV